MTIYVQEGEMIERYVDGLKKAASRAKEFITAEEVNKPTLFVEFIEALKIAAGSAHQLAHAQENPNFLDIRDTIEKVIEIGQTLPTFNGRQAGMWLSIKVSLEGLAEKGNRMATAKSMARQDVLKNLDIRQENVKTDA